MTHTPGPWTAEPPGIYGYGAEDDKYWAVQTEDERICLLTGGDSEESDARLIAAAPELLVALREAYSAITYMMSNDDCGGAANALEAVVAAIAKAEGRE
jgi:hypothetical protein